MSIDFYKLAVLTVWLKRQCLARNQAAVTAGVDHRIQNAAAPCAVVTLRDDSRRVTDRTKTVSAAAGLSLAGCRFLSGDSDDPADGNGRMLTDSIERTSDND